MLLALECPVCKKSLRLAESAVGKRAKCPACGEMFVVPVSVPFVETEQDATVSSSGTAEDRRIARLERRSIFQTLTIIVLSGLLVASALVMALGGLEPAKSHPKKAPVAVKAKAKAAPVDAKLEEIAKRVPGWKNPAWRKAWETAPMSMKVAMLSEPDLISPDDPRAEDAKAIMKSATASFQENAAEIYQITYDLWQRLEAEGFKCTPIELLDTINYTSKELKTGDRLGRYRDRAEFYYGIRSAGKHTHSRTVALMQAMTDVLSPGESDGKPTTPPADPVLRHPAP